MVKPLCCIASSAERLCAPVCGRGNESLVRSTLWASAAVGLVLHGASLDPGTALETPFLPCPSQPLFTEPLLRVPLLEEPLVGERLFRESLVRDPLLRGPLLNGTGEAGMGCCTDLEGASMLPVVVKLSGADLAGSLLVTLVDLKPLHVSCTHTHKTKSRPQNRHTDVCMCLSTCRQACVLLRETTLTQLA